METRLRRPLPSSSCSPRRYPPRRSVEGLAHSARRGAERPVWLLTSRAPRWRSAITRSSCTEPLYRTALSRATASLATVTRAAWLLMRASPFCLVHGCPGRAPQCGQPTVRTSARSSMRSRAYCGMGRRVGSRARARPEGSTPPAARFIRSAWSAHSSPSSLRQGRRGSAPHRRQMYSRARRAPPDTGRAYRRSRRRCSVNPGQARHLACAASAACGCLSGVGGAGWHSCRTCACACGGAACRAIHGRVAVRVSLGRVALRPDTPHRAAVARPSPHPAGQRHVRPPAWRAPAHRSLLWRTRPAG